MGDSQPLDDHVNTEAEKLVKTFNDVFQGLGTIKTKAKIHIDKDIEPIIDPPRRIPHVIEDKAREELDRLIKLGVVVEETEPTPWISSITIGCFFKQ